MFRLTKLLPLLVLLVMGALLYQRMSGDGSDHSLSTPLAGQPIAAFELPGLEGDQTLTNADLPGNPFLLNVWASWCVACAAEHLVLAQGARDAEVPLVGLNYRDHPEDARTWLKARGDIYRFSLADTKGRLAVNLGVSGVPETFVVDGRGLVRGRRVGAVNQRVWREQLLPLILHLQREARQ